MRLLRNLFRRVRGLVGAETIHREIDEEARFHIEMRIDENIRRGMSPEEARQDAERRFGNLTRMKERGYEVRGGRWLETLWQDLRYGARMMLKNPGFTLVSVFTLALGIGANTAIFSVVNAVLIKPLSYGEPDRIVMLWMDTSGVGVNIPWGPVPLDITEWRKGVGTFDQIAAIRLSNADLSEDGDPERAAAVDVTANFFAAIGVRPQLGREFSVDEEQPGRDKVVIISHDLWQRRFGGEADIIGRLITVNRERRAVVGVMPPEFHFPRGAEFAVFGGLPPRTDIWLPYAESAEYWQRNNMRQGGAIGRMKRGVPLAQAEAEINAIFRRVAETHPNNHTGWRVYLQPLTSQVTQQSRPVLFVLLGAVGFVLLIACANVANLLLGRTNARQKEMAVRAALGAGWSRIIRQLLTESVLLSGTGGAIGLLVGAWCLPAILAFSPPNIARIHETTLDGRVLLFTIFVSLITGVLFGLGPAWHVSRINLTGMLNAGRRAGAATGQNLLVIAEVALAVVLLAGAGLMVQSLLRLQSVDPGFKAEQVVAFDVGLHGGGYASQDRMRQFYRDTRERLSKLPGVEAAAATSVVPLQGGGDNQWLVAEGRPIDYARTINADRVEVTPGYFETMGMTLVRGRDFTDFDKADTQQVCIINETTARDFFPGLDPIGKRLKLGTASEYAPWFTVVGVVRDVRFETLELKVRPQVYRPVEQNTGNMMTFVVRYDGTPADSLQMMLRAELKAIDSAMPLANFRTMESLVSDALARPRFSAFLLSLFAVTALLLTVVGIYGVVAYAVNQCTREIGVRMALGAEASNVLLMVIWHGMKLTLIGVALGLGAALALTRMIKNMLFNVSTTDPATFTLIVLLLVGVALIAIYIPARRATKVDPLLALRHE
jgi:putative ABC transport system permease protein